MRSLWLILFVVALAAVAAIDVDGDPTTSNVTSVVLTTDRTTVDAAAVEASQEAGTSRRTGSGSLLSTVTYLLRVRPLGVSCKRSIRGP